jgi:UDP-glucose 4-epimerase
MTDDEIARATLITGDITEAGVLSPIIDKFAITHIIHLAGLQVPICKADPRLGAMVNVIGTINVFEAARRAGDSIRGRRRGSAAYLQSDRRRALAVERDAAEPATHYGAFKRCNEDNARSITGPRRQQHRRPLRSTALGETLRANVGPNKSDESSSHRAPVSCASVEDRFSVHRRYSRYLYSRLNI